MDGVDLLLPALDPLCDVEPEGGEILVQGLSLEIVDDFVNGAARYPLGSVGAGFSLEFSILFARRRGAGLCGVAGAGVQQNDHSTEEVQQRVGGLQTVHDGVGLCGF